MERKREREKRKIIRREFEGTTVASTEWDEKATWTMETIRYSADSAILRM